MSEVVESWETFSARWDDTIARLEAEFPAGWSVTGYQGHPTHNGVSWVAQLRFDGKVVAQLEDSGMGSAVAVFFTDKETSARFWADVNAALPDEKHEPDQLVIEALLRRSGY